MGRVARMHEDERLQRRLAFIEKLQYLKGDLLQLGPRTQSELEESVRSTIRSIPELTDKEEELVSWFLERPDCRALGRRGLLSHGAYYREVADYLLQYLPDEQAELVRRNVSFGSIPHREVDAICARVPEAGFVIALNDGVLAYSSAVARVIANSLQLPGLWDEPAKVAESDARSLITELVHGYPDDKFMERVDAQPAAYPVEFETARGVFRMQLSRHWVLFLLAHEIGHVVLGHNESTKNEDVVASGGRVGVVRHTWPEEYNSDLFAWRLLARHDTSSRDRNVSLGMQFGVHSLFLFRKAVEALPGVGQPVHPPADRRRRELMTQIRYSEPFRQAIRRLEHLFKPRRLTPGVQL